MVLTVKVPRFVYEDIELSKFREHCLKHLGNTEPKFEFSDVVTYTDSIGKKIPCVVVGSDYRISEWFYFLLRIRDYDATVESFQASESDLMLVERG